MARTLCTAGGVALCAIAFAEPTAAQTAHGLAPTDTTLPARGDRRAQPQPAVAARRVVLIDAPEPLRRALRTALLPWGMQLDGVVRDRPEPTLPGTALRARELARELDAEALVWVSANGDGAALWLYEFSRDTIRARPFPDRPLDDALAAALALSVKTWLLTSAEPPEPPAMARSAAVEAPPKSRVLVPRGSPTQLEAKAAPSKPDRPRSSVLIHASAREGALGPDQLEARYGLEVRTAAWRSDTGASRLLLAAQIETGAPSDANNPSFRGTYFHWGVGLSLGFAQRLTPALSLNLLGGVAIERATLRGTLLPDGIVTERTRWATAAELRPELELAVGPLGLVLQPVLYAARPRQYAFHDVEVFRTRLIWGALGGALSIGLF